MRSPVWKTPNETFFPGIQNSLLANCRATKLVEMDFAIFSSTSASLWSAVATTALGVLKSEAPAICSMTDTCDFG